MVRISRARSAAPKRMGLLCACAVALGMAAQAQAVTIYAYDNLGTTNAGTVGDRFFRFDSTNPAGTAVNLGQSGVASTLMAGLDFDRSGALWASSGTRLFSVNPLNGAATGVGASLGLPAGRTVSDLSFNPVTNQLQAVTIQGAAAPFTTSLYTINTTTGVANLVGDIVISSSSVNVGLATNSAGVNYVHDLQTDTMFRLAGLVATALPQPTGVNSNFSQGMTIDWQAGPTGQWFMAPINNTPTFFSEIRTVNEVTGVATVIVPGGTWPNLPSGFPTYEPGDLAIPTVPEPASLGLVAAAGLFAGRRRRH